MCVCASVCGWANIHSTIRQAGITPKENNNKPQLRKLGENLRVGLSEREQMSETERVQLQVRVRMRAKHSTIAQLAKKDTYIRRNGGGSLCWSWQRCLNAVTSSVTRNMYMNTYIFICIYIHIYFANILRNISVNLLSLRLAFGQKTSK